MAKIIYKPIRLLDKKNVQSFKQNINEGKELKLSVKFPCDLRASLKMKIEEADSSGWTAFVNNKGTLAHMIYFDDEILIRVPFKPAIAGASPERMHRILLERLKKRLYFLD